jgi:hypothetical protein
VVLFGLLLVFEHLALIGGFLTKRQLVTQVETSHLLIFFLIICNQYCLGILGGEYILIDNAPLILSNVILSVINGGYTLLQAFLQIYTGAATTNGAGDINEPDGATDGVGDLPFDHGLSD